jgi:hypothetical protein
VSESLGNRTAVYESTLRNTLGSLTQKLRFGLRETGGELPDFVPQEQPLDVAVLRLIDAPEKAKRLAALLEQAKDPRFHALPHTAQRVQSFQVSLNLRGSLQSLQVTLISKIPCNLSRLLRPKRFLQSFQVV